MFCKTVFQTSFGICGTLFQKSIECFIVPSSMFHFHCDATTFIIFLKLICFQHTGLHVISFTQIVLANHLHQISAKSHKNVRRKKFCPKRGIQPRTVMGGRNIGARAPSEPTRLQRQRRGKGGGIAEVRFIYANSLLSI